MPINVRVFTTRICAPMLCSLLWAAPGHAQQSTIDKLVKDIVHDVVDRTVDAAREKVVENTGIDLSERGYRKGVKHRPLPGAASDESRRELRKLQREHDRKIAKLEEELQRKLEKAKAEFEREAAKEDKPEKVREKRHKLQDKVNTAVAKFDEKVDEENSRFDEKRDQIVQKERQRAGA